MSYFIRSEDCLEIKTRRSVGLVIRTGKLLYRPEGWTSEALFYPIDVFAERANRSRRQIDRHIEAGELTKVKWMGLSWIPIHELDRLGITAKEQNEPDVEAEQHTAAGTPAEPETKTEPQTGRTS